ncbi:MAG: OmpA family protein [Verrucomicrobiaceae bacterium]|nr:MAG: OmpA family protein [Verrucomicrobiaceae bacterium]
MASSSPPRWDALGSGPGFRTTTTAWDLRWWILMAVMTSVVVHAGLFVWMKRTKLSVPTVQVTPKELRTGVFHTEVERVTVPADIMKDLTPQTPDLTQKVPETSAVIAVPDITQLAEALKERDLIMTPTIKTPAANVTLSTPAPGTAGDLTDDLAAIRAAPENLTNTILSKSSMLKNPQRAADDQVSLDLNEATGGGADLKSDILSSSKKGTGGNGGVDGFASLDDLVNYKGPIEGDFKTMLKTDLLFDFASAELKSDARISLQKLAAIIQTNDNAVFRLIGHTDTIGDGVSNQALSEARAQAVKDWLVETLRIDGTNILVEGRGETEPLKEVNPNGTAAEQALNRRVEIHKTKK